MPVPKDLLDLMCCSLCKADLRLEQAGGAERLCCTHPDCGLVYAVEDDIPNMLIDEAQRPCPKCSKPRGWDEESSTLACAACGATFRYVPGGATPPSR
jgi:hypothetical protein